VASVCRISVAEDSFPFQASHDGVRLALAKIHIERVCGLQRRRCYTGVRIANLSDGVSYPNVCAIRRCLSTVAKRCVWNAGITVLKTGLGVIDHNLFVKVTSRCWLICRTIRRTICRILRRTGCRTIRRTGRRTCCRTGRRTGCRTCCRTGRRTGCRTCCRRVCFCIAYTIIRILRSFTTRPTIDICIPKKNNSVVRNATGLRFGDVRFTCINTASTLYLH